jgi:hypothetical protein
MIQEISVILWNSAVRKERESSAVLRISAVRIEIEISAVRIEKEDSAVLRFPLYGKIRREFSCAENIRCTDRKRIYLGCEVRMFR